MRPRPRTFRHGGGGGDGRPGPYLGDGAGGARQAPPGRGQTSAASAASMSAADAGTAGWAMKSVTDRSA
jgi:hypothetical protein